MPASSFIYPETYGAVGNGVANDYAAMAAAVAATTGGNMLVLTQNYAIGTTLSINCNVWSTPTSSILPFGGLANLVLIVTGGQGNLECIFGQFRNFSGTAIEIASGALVWRLKTNIISGSSTVTSVALFNNGGGVSADIAQISGCNKCFQVSSGTNVLQGNTFRCDFANGNQYGLYFDGSPFANANTCIFSSWDNDSVANSCIFYNSKAGGNNLTNWTLTVEDWLGNAGTGGITPGFIAQGSFNQCKFSLGSLSQINSSTWNCFECTGLQNSVTNTGITGSPAVTATWQTVSNNRAAFSANTWYLNSEYCTGTIGPSIAAGGSITLYVYSPYTSSQLGNSFGCRVSGAISSSNLTAAKGSGLVCTQIFDNSATVANELILTITNTSSTATSASIPYAFYLISGMP